MDFDSPGWSRGWSGDVEKFEILNGELRSASEEINDTFQIVHDVPSFSDWHIRLECRLEFKTSSANFVEFVLEGSGDTTVVIRLGGSADELALWLISPAWSLYGTWLKNKTENSSWQLDFYRSDSGSVCIQANDPKAGLHQIIATQIHEFAPIRFGIRVRQSTAGFFKKHVFDNLYLGPVLRDTSAPAIIAHHLVNKSELILEFDEAIDTVISKPKCSHQSKNIPARFLSVHTLSINLSEAELINNSNPELHLYGIRDPAGNNLDSVFRFHYLYGETAIPGQIRITEVFPDPAPSIGLPNAEFIELTNLSTEFLELGNLTISDPGTTATLGSYILPPNQSVILCRLADSALYDKFGPVLALKSWPALNNDSDSLSIYTQDSKLIDKLEYDLDRFSNHWKYEGGWTFEPAHHELLCLGFGGWTFSESSTGGTPGKYIPSVKAFKPEPFRLVRHEALADSSIVLYFNSPVESNWESIEIQSKTGDVLPEEIRFDEKTLTLSLPFQMDSGVCYTLSLKTITDCIGRTLDTSFATGFPVSIGPNDVILSEILFNPPTGGSDFIEIYNQSDRLLGVSGLYVFSRDSTGELSHYKALSAGRELLPPKSFIAFSSDPEWVKNHYHPPRDAQIRLSKTLPTLPDQSGNVGLASTDATQLDFLVYTDDMHSFLLHSRDGVSLERSFSPHAHNFPPIWKSASYSVGYATPGYQNSRSLGGKAEVRFEFYPKQFSPNNDGTDDYLEIHWVHPERSEAALYIQIFDRPGNFLTSIRNGEIASETDVSTWDGSLPDGTQLPAGDYIVWAMARLSDGRVIRDKAAVVLIR